MPVLSILADYIQVLYSAVPITLLLAGLFGYLLVRRLLGPIDSITKALQKTHDSDVDRMIITPADYDELDRLSLTIDQTIGKLRDTIEHERRFSSEVTHELRTPLAFIGSEASLTLSRPRNKEDYQISLENISRQVSHMSSVINKLLFLSRIDHQKEIVERNDVNLWDNLTDVITMTQPYCEERNIAITSSPVDYVKINGDEVKLKALFLNLVDNAIKYTPDGGTITVSLQVSDGNACLSITDTGIGVAAEHLPHLFERFYRAPGVEPFTGSGSGLGLSICQEIAKLHGGTIEAESRVGKGSSFIVTLPIQLGK